MKRQSAWMVALVVCLLAFFPTATLVGDDNSQSVTLPSNFISSEVPTTVQDYDGNGSVDATDAAIFAWEQFIALNWPADCSTSGDSDCSRGQADDGAALGSSSTTTWMTYRNKVEVIIGSVPPKGCVEVGGANSGPCTYDGNPANNNYKPNGGPFYGLNPNSYIDPPGKGYHTNPPLYIYAKTSKTSVRSSDPSYKPRTTSDGQTLDYIDIAPCSSDFQYIDAKPNNTQPAVTNAAFVNLDETNQIGRNEMFSGMYDADASSQYPRIEKNMMRYLAKHNEIVYQYATRNGYYGTPVRGDSSDPITAEGAALVALQQQGESTTPNTVSGAEPDILNPLGSIEIKTAWRRLSPVEARSGRFLTQNVRYYYQYKNGNDDDYCYVESQDQGETWGMVALHIIQKTETFPGYFTFATFGQIDNLVDSFGNETETPAGAPTVTITSPTDPDVRPVTPASYSSGTFNPETFGIANADCTPGHRLYYLNNEEDYSNVPKGPICFDGRWNQIPTEFQNVNTAAQSAVAGQGPFSFYRLTGVQWKPFTFNQSGFGTGDYQEGIYYLANEVVETNYNLQNFRGGQTTAHFPGLISDVGSGNGDPNPGTLTGGGQYNNTFTYAGGGTWKLNNMGGCMGCHGVAQLGGGDFSFVLAGIGTSKPDTFSEDSQKEGLQRFDPTTE